MAYRHFIDLLQLEASELRAIMDTAHAMKQARQGWPKGKPDADPALAGHTMAMVFEKNSTRTRFSFEAAMRQLGGDSIIATASEKQLGRGETAEDTARVPSRYVAMGMV